MATAVQLRVSGRLFRCQAPGCGSQEFIPEGKQSNVLTCPCGQQYRCPGRRPQ